MTIPLTQSAHIPGRTVMPSSPRSGGPQCLLILADCWPVGTALEALTRQCYPACDVMACYDRRMLTSLLQRHPQAPVLLCLTPHERVYLLNRLSSRLAGRQVMVVSPGFYFSDETVVELLLPGALMISLWQLYPMLDVRTPGESSLLHHLAENAGAGRVSRRGQLSSRGVLENINAVMLGRLSERLTRREFGIISLLWQGDSLQDVEMKTGCRTPVVSHYRQGVTRRLGMVPRPMTFFRGGFLRASLQRTDMEGKETDE